MITAAEMLQEDVMRLESAFVAKLSRLGHDDLVSDYKDIVTLRNAVTVMSRRPARQGRANNSRERVLTGRDSGNPPYPPGFVLSEAVRDAIREIGLNGRFRMSTVFSILQTKYPELITLERRRSIAATLSNLAASGEINKETDGQRKVWYRALNLKAGDQRAETESLFNEDDMRDLMADDEEPDEG